MKSGKRWTWRLRVGPLDDAIATDVVGVIQAYESALRSFAFMVRTDTDATLVSTAQTKANPASKQHNAAAIMSTLDSVPCHEALQELVCFLGVPIIATCSCVCQLLVSIFGKVYVDQCRYIL